MIEFCFFKNDSNIVIVTVDFKTFDNINDLNL